MFIAAYHYDVDLFRLPLLLWQLVPDYKIYLRKHPYVPAWELNFFFVIFNNEVKKLPTGSFYFTFLQWDYRSPYRTKKRQM